MANQEYQSPLAQSLRDAEQVIGNIVAQPDAQWDVAPHKWVVGGNVAELPERVNGGDKVLVTQALGPNAAENNDVRYTADTPYGKLAWRAGATALHQISHDPADAASIWTDVAMARRGLDTVKAAQPKPSDTPE